MYDTDTAAGPRHSALSSRPTAVTTAFAGLVAAVAFGIAETMVRAARDWFRTGADGKRPR
ncbi:hypothetical protein [Nocardia sp. NBC_00416]|uniref:hypothetical protein n=1 Tax=Nocardia sp. NBC_00416 TaxID=2975991 RepID=UPI002E1C3341